MAVSLTAQQASLGLRKPRSGRFQSSEQVSTDAEILCQPLVVSLFTSAPRPKQVLGGLLIEGVKTLTLPFFFYLILFIIYFQLCWVFTAAQAFLCGERGSSRVMVLRPLTAAAAAAEHGPWGVQASTAAAHALSSGFRAPEYELDSCASWA